MIRFRAGKFSGVGGVQRQFRNDGAAHSPRSRRRAGRSPVDSSARPHPSTTERAPAGDLQRAAVSSGVDAPRAPETTVVMPDCAARAVSVPACSGPCVEHSREPTMATACRLARSDAVRPTRTHRTSAAGSGSAGGSSGYWRAERGKTPSQAAKLQLNHRSCSFAARAPA